MCMAEQAMFGEMMSILSIFRKGTHFSCAVCPACKMLLLPHEKQVCCLESSEVTQNCLALHRIIALGLSRLETRGQHEL